MHRLTIQYAVPDDPQAFDTRYAESHVPLVLPVPGLRAFSWSKVRPMGGEQSVYLVAQLDFDDREAMKAALASPEMTAAGLDADDLGVPRVMFSGEVTTLPAARD
ncbi:putative ethyl tert-butyl ether degradation protein [metagenome]|uniref:Putative ethyl tert-butyl ether degradation protein n=1 Tax=metagenome TaxID=256318 RepID=A0A2P2C1E5_9ZZZZ